MPWKKELLCFQYIFNFPLPLILSLFFFFNSNLQEQAQGSETHCSHSQESHKMLASHKMLSAIIHTGDLAQTCVGPVLAAPVPELLCLALLS